LYNIFYEVFTVCTSIVAEDKTGNSSRLRKGEKCKEVSIKETYKKGWINAKDLRCSF